MVRAKATISAVSAIAGMSFGGTNEPTSISLSPASASARTQAFFAAVDRERFAGAEQSGEVGGRIGTRSDGGELDECGAGAAFAAFADMADGKADEPTGVTKEQRFSKAVLVDGADLGSRIQTGKEFIRELGALPQARSVTI